MFEHCSCEYVSNNGCLSKNYAVQIKSRLSTSKNFFANDFLKIIVWYYTF